MDIRRGSAMVETWFARLIESIAASGPILKEVTLIADDLS